MGHYPDIDMNLQLKDDKNIYVIGDCGGIFRGIIASMISGHYTALNIIN